MKYFKWIHIVLVICILLSILPAASLAASTPMTFSESLVTFMKDCEGFNEMAYWDYQQYTIGYGSTCKEGEYPNGITREEADALLRKSLQAKANSVNSFVKKNGLNPTQSEFDCMVSITYSVGEHWMGSSYTLPKLMIQGSTELELLNCLGGWVVAGNQTLDPLIRRRMCENYIYFHGKYCKLSEVSKEVPYACLKFDAMGGTVEYLRVYTFRGEAYGLEKKLPVPTKSGYRFAGWYDGSGKKVTDATVAEQTITTVYAHWDKGSELFTDVSESDWWYHDVKRATEQGIFTGYNDGRFGPEDGMSRAMFAQVLYRMAGNPKCTGAVPFTDVAAGKWYYNAVRWAYNGEIVNGVSPEAFAPDASITREQMATMLYRYSQRHGGVDLQASQSYGGFADALEVSAFAQKPMRWAVGMGLIRSGSDNRLYPKKTATRAEAAAILVRLTTMMKGVVA